jgi:Zinc knuckle
MDIGALGPQSGTQPAYRGNRGGKKPAFNTQRGRFVQTNRRTFNSNQKRGFPLQNCYRTAPAGNNYRGHHPRSFGNNRSPNWKPRPLKPQEDGCYVCGDKGHFAKECPNKQPLQSQAGANTTNYVAPKSQMPATRPSAPRTAPKQAVSSRRPPMPSSAMALNYAGNSARYTVDSDESESKNRKGWMQQ